MPVFYDFFFSVTHTLYNLSNKLCVISVPHRGYVDTKSEKQFRGMFHTLVFFLNGNKWQYGTVFVTLGKPKDSPELTL